MLAAAALALFVLTFIERPAADPFGWTPEAWAIAIYLGTFGSAAPFFLYNYALRRMSAGQTSLFGPLVGPVGAAFSALWIGEAIGPHLLGAMGLILLGAFLPAIADRLRPRRQAQ
jgi:drug/metabolite transporter (DMT)-like permease